ncbi:hypothetical protein AB0M44_48560 [Streptosporangium subroseum]
MATGKIADFAGEAAAADAGVLKDYAPPKCVAVLACLAHKAQMRARDGVPVASAENPTDMPDLH